MLIEQVPQTVVYFASFLLIALAAQQIGKFFSTYGLPYITGYLLTGMIAGPFILGFLPTGATDDLRLIDDISLAVIAFIAGSELYLPELKDRLRSILLNMGGVVLAGLLLIGITLFFLTTLIPFTQDLSTTSRIAVALLGSTILLALSPASTIAVIQEVRAKGTFTKTILSITVVMDVAIIVLFAISTAFASTLLTDSTFEISFLIWLLIDLGLAVLIGIAIGQILRLILATPLASVAKIIAILTTGALLFAGSLWIDDLKLGIHLEPLLSAMIAGFYITNYTAYRTEFEKILHDVSPMVYVAFFALTGVALKLDVLLATGGIAFGLFLARIVAIFVGSYIGGTITDESITFRRYAWMGLITQAGIALGLAREVAVEFPDTLGDSFATLIISVVVLNEIFGPLFLKNALRRVDEAAEPAQLTKPDDRIRDVVIVGIEDQSILLARMLQTHGWQIIMADTDKTHVNYLQTDDLTELHARHLANIQPDNLSQLLQSGTDAVVAMLPDDDENLAICEYAYKHLGLSRIIVRLADPTRRDQFARFNALVLDTASAMVNLLDQYVRAPQSTQRFLHQRTDYDIVQITVTDRDIDGQLLRNLRLPTDVLILEITRNGQSVVPRGHTPIHTRDEVTLVGKPESLREATLKLGF